MPPIKNLGKIDILHIPMDFTHTVLYSYFWKWLANHTIFDEAFRLFQKGRMSMNKAYVPFRDPQAAIPPGRCPVCGREVYGQAGECLYCQRYGSDPQGNQ